MSSSFVLAACSEGLGGSDNNDPYMAAAQSGTLAVQSRSPLTKPLSNDAFNGLDPITQYRVANKLHSTFYKGMSVSEYFKMESGLETPVTINGGNYYARLVNRLQTDLSAEEQQRFDLSILGSDFVETESSQMLAGKYTFSRDKARELPLARIHVYPMSRQVYVQWMAWHLANSILFSPAADLDSAGMTDVQNVVRRLTNGIAANQTIAEIVEAHMRSEENWRRFRSPEDNTREMMEIFLGMEDQDADVPAASKACQDWYLTDENDGYKLSFTDFPNIESQQVLDSSVVTCDDFYSLVANHPNLLPTVTSTLVRYFYAEHTFAFKQNMVQAIIASQPQTFNDLFSLIVFSEEYLLNTERMLSYEESFLATAQRLRWSAREDTFRSLASGRGGLYRSDMAQMGWPTMSAKLGRVAGVATDSLSFANFHKGYREELLLDRYRWSRSLGIREQESADEAARVISAQELARRQALNKQIKRLTIDELIDYLFLSVALRRASELEKTELTRIFDDNDFLRHEEERTYVHDGRMPHLARMSFDYLSRLSELYYFKSEMLTVNNALGEPQ